MTLSLPGTFAPRLWEHLASARKDFIESLNRGQGPKEPVTGTFAPIPNPDELRELLDVAFFASIQREEGRDVTFALEWAPPASAGLQLIIAKLESPVSLDPPKLAKLSPAIRAPVSLAVTSLPPHGWAILRQEGFPALNFRLLVRRPGSLLVSYAYETHFTYEAGVGVITGFKNEPGEDHHARMILEGALIDEEKFPAKWKVEAIFDIALECVQEGHGATLILLPDHRVPARVVTRAHLAIPHEWEGLPVALEAIHEQGAREPRILDWYRQTVRAVARLASIDGAVLLDRDLRVVGFGTILACAPYVGLVNPQDRPRGARHNAAINFVGEFESATAVVISQDARITVVTNSGSAVNCTRVTDLRRSSDL